MPGKGEMFSKGHNDISKLATKDFMLRGRVDAFKVVLQNEVHITFRTILG